MDIITLILIVLIIYIVLVVVAGGPWFPLSGSIGYSPFGLTLFVLLIVLILTIAKR